MAVVTSVVRAELNVRAFLHELQLQLLVSLTQSSIVTLIVFVASRSPNVALT